MLRLFIFAFFFFNLILSAQENQAADAANDFIEETDSPFSLSGFFRSGLNGLREKPHRGRDSLQRQVDEQVRRSMQRLAGHPAVQAELKRIEDSLRRLERQLQGLQRHPARTRKRRRPAR